MWVTVWPKQQTLPSSFFEDTPFAKTMFSRNPVLSSPRAFPGEKLLVDLSIKRLLLDTINQDYPYIFKHLQSYGLEFRD